jgi:hypothetical protein
MNKPDDLEAPDFAGRPFTSRAPEDETPSRAHGWAMVVAVLLAVIGFSELSKGSVAGGLVFLALAGGMVGLMAGMVRKELRRFMEYRRRL